MTAAVLPADRWELTAPESYLLRFTGCKPRGIDAFTLALQELVARDALGLQGARIPRRLGIGTRAAWLVTAGPARESATEPALTAALAVFERAFDTRGRSTVDGVALDDLRRQAVREFGSGLRRYLEHDLAGALRLRGLLDADGRRTAAGRRADDELDAWLAIGRERLKNWAANPRVPAQATEFLLGAGAAVLLIHDVHPSLARIAERMQTAPYDHAAMTWTYDVDLDLFNGALAALGDVMAFDAVFGDVGLSW
jgi:hypothetical protein